MERLSILAFTLLSILLVIQLPPIPQWISYHQFADTRIIWGIPNFWNVISNIPLLLVGLLGLITIRRQWRAGNFTNGQEVTPFLILALGAILTAIGSSYYHLAPTNERLVWDRLAMTLIFTTLLSLTLIERVNFKLGLWSLIPLIACGLASVWYWIWSESLGRGDLRSYGFIKFYSIALILLILALFPKSFPSTKSYLWVFLFYALATFFEFADLQVYQLSGFVSGHTLKHLFVAIAAYGFVMMMNELPNVQ